MTKKNTLHFNQPAPDFTLPDTEGNPVRLSKLWKQRTLLLSFTRHFGCTQCKEMLDELVQGREQIKTAGLGLAVITQGVPAEAARFAAQFAPGLQVLCDPQREVYQAYGLERGNLFQTFLNPHVWAALAKSRRKGYQVEPPPAGQDAMQMSGTFVINRAGRVLMPFYYDDIADHPPLELLLMGVLNTPWEHDFEGPVGDFPTPKKSKVK